MILLSKGLSSVFSNTTILKHQFFYAQPSSLWSNSHIHLLKNRNFDYMDLCPQSDVSPSPFQPVGTPHPPPTHTHTHTSLQEFLGACPARANFSDAGVVEPYKDHELREGWAGHKGESRTVAS